MAQVKFCPCHRPPMPMNPTPLEQAEASLSDTDRKVILELCEQADHLFQMMANLRQPQYGRETLDYVNALPQKGDFEKGNSKFVRLRSLPRDFHHALLSVMPDGIKYDKNGDFLKYLMKRYPWFREANPLGDKTWEEVASGSSEKSTGVLPKEQRDKLAAENSLILDEHGNFVKASEAA